MQTEAESEQEQRTSSVYFHHARNINVGKARLIWADEVHVDPYARRIAMAAGWVLPGGERTTDQRRAFEVAKAMDECMTRNGA